LPLLDRELSRLPEKYQVPLVLCDLEGKTKKEAARQLGLADGTVSSRLARARALLRKRLERHAPALSAGSLGAALSQDAAGAGVPGPLVVSTARAATAVATGGAAAPVVSAAVAALTEGVLKAMLLTKLRIVTAFALAVGLCLVGGGVLTYHAFA